MSYENWLKELRDEDNRLGLGFVFRPSIELIKMYGRYLMSLNESK